MNDVLLECWVNVYPGEDALQVRRTKDDCDACAGGDRIACVRVVYRVGQFDSDAS